MSSFDRFYRRFINSPFFSKGWGRPDIILKLIEHLPLISKKDKMMQVVRNGRPVKITKEEIHKNLVLIEGSFVSPVASFMPEYLEGSNRISQFQMIIPRKWPTKYKPICFHFSGTGDHHYARRRIFLANKLLEDGIGSMLVMNPYYSSRKPASQKGSSLNYLSDLFTMGGALMTECNSLLGWCELHGYGPFALHGISMGGFMASICAASSHRPISLIPCLSSTSASCVFVDGVLSHSVDWKTLTKQYYDDAVFSKEIRPRLVGVPEKYRVPLDKISSHDDRNNPDVSKPKDYLHVAENNEKKLVLPADSKAPPIDLSYWRRLDFSKLSSVVLNPASGWGLDSYSWFSSSAPDPSNNENALVVPPVEADPEIKQFMREMLDSFTHLANFPQLMDPRLLYAVVAEQDAYVPMNGVTPFTKLYPGAVIRYLPQMGHVGAYLRNAFWDRDFRDAICDSLNKHIELHYDSEGPFGVSRIQASNSTKISESNISGVREARTTERKASSARLSKIYAQSSNSNNSSTHEAHDDSSKKSEKSKEKVAETKQEDS